MTSDKQDLFKSAYEEYSRTLERQHDIQDLLTEKAVEVVKVDLLVGSIAASVVTLRPESVSMAYFVAGSLTLLWSVYLNLKVYSPTTTYDIGISGGSFEDMKSKPLEEHYGRLAEEYSGMVTDFRPTYEWEAGTFDRGLWLAGVTIFLFLAGSVATFLRTIEDLDYPIWLDFGVIVLILGLLYYARRRTLAEPEQD